MIGLPQPDPPWFAVNGLIELSSTLNVNTCCSLHPFVSINRHRTHLLSDPAISGLKFAGMENRLSVGNAGVHDQLIPSRGKGLQNRMF